jgi:hypothetical protein
VQGVRTKRVEDEQYYALVDEFMMAVKDKWPKCLVQFEDFSNNHCFELLERYRYLDHTRSLSRRVVVSRSQRAHPTCVACACAGTRSSPSTTTSRELAPSSRRALSTPRA